MTNQSADKWCQAALPKDFAQITRDTQKIQQFLSKQLPDPLCEQVQVVSVSAENISIAVADPQIANYLRLYKAEIQQQIYETFNLNQTLKVITSPASELQPSRLSYPVRKPARVMPETTKAIQRSADWIENDELKQALKSLADSLNKK